MLQCPKCNKDSTVKDSRWSEKRGLLLRRRNCLACDLRWSTLEISVDQYEALIKDRADLEQLRNLIGK